MSSHHPCMAHGRYACRIPCIWIYPHCVSTCHKHGTGVNRPCIVLPCQCSRHTHNKCHGHTSRILFAPCCSRIWSSLSWKEGVCYVKGANAGLAGSLAVANLQAMSLYAVRCIIPWTVTCVGTMLIPTARTRCNTIRGQSFTPTCTVRTRWIEDSTPNCA